jgi:Flp pilus assembly protein TadD
MIAAFLVALSAAAVSPSAQVPSAAQVEEARKAIAAGRLDQARIMIGRAIASGASGDLIDRALADLAFASDKYSEAIVRYQQLLQRHPDDVGLLQDAGIAALYLGDVGTAEAVIDRAARLPSASWRTWNARGVIADLQHDWPQADTAYQKAAQLSPRRPEVLNNRGWSLLIRGDWAGAVTYFERALKYDGKSERIANNLELARDALAAELPRRETGESDSDWAARLNDAGVAAQLLGDKQRAIAAFSQALEASGSWYQRAANNLQAVSGR